jgi:hypothetical protein
MLVDVPIHGLSPAAIKERILAVGDEAFEVVFRKRTTGALRSMRAKLGAYKGGAKSMKMANDNLLPVIDTEAGDWRAINLDGVVSLRVPAPVEEGDAA